MLEAVEIMRQTAQAEPKKFPAFHLQPSYSCFTYPPAAEEVEISRGKEPVEG
jgi:hypothetical protein